MSSAVLSADEQVLARLEEVTRDAARLQEETLRSILAANAGAAYLRRRIPNNLHASADAAAEFRRLLPITSYEDYADAIQRIADGDAAPDQLFLFPLLCFFLSSGTSSLRSKPVPFFDSPGAKAASSLVVQASSALVRRLYPPRPTVNKTLWFLYAGNVGKTKSGLEAMAATAWGIRNSLRGPLPMSSFCISPLAVILGSDNQQQLYCHLLCGLRWPDKIDAIRAPYAAGLVRAIRLLESKWQQLCDDIESGVVSEDISEAEMREAVQDVLAGPSPDRANKIREICRKESWGGVLHELWPESRYISCISTGVMEQYYPVIKYFAGPSLPLLGVDYLSSECPIGINLDRTLPPEQTTYVLLATAGYFEFLPFSMEETSEGRETVDISGVEAGTMYEIMATTYRGLYRYRLGDVVKVVGFHNSSPKLQFVTRAPKKPSEMFTERDLMAAMESFQLMLKDESGGELIEFAGLSNTDANACRVSVFVEVGKRSKLLEKGKLEETSAFLRRCRTPLEGCLGSAYKLRRAHADVGPLEVAVVSPGSFERLAEAAIRNGASANQYKPPKIIRHQHLVEVLRSSVVCSSNEDHCL